MRGRVKGLLGGAPPANEGAPQVAAPAEAPTDPDTQRQALQVLTLAQRTADEHVASAHRQAEKITADAHTRAEQLAREAQGRAHDLRREADKTLAEARTTAEQMAREAQAHADSARRNAETILADARARAEEVAKEAQAHSDELRHQADQRYQDVVGSLADKREALQKQIEALEQFDRDYRARLTTFMQTQLRALWVDQPNMDGEIDEVGTVPASGSLPAQSSR